MATDELLSSIHPFISAVESGSFARAANKLGLTRSAVGKSVARLERRLGARMFHRTTRAQTLTEDGQMFYERCRRALDEIDAAEAALDAGRREPHGQLRVSAPLWFGRHCVAPVLSELARRHKRLDLEISFSDRAVDLLEERFDLAVRIGALRDSSNLAARHLGVQKFVMCASPTYIGRGRRPTRAEDFASLTALTYSRAGRGDDAWEIDDNGRRRALSFARHMRFDDIEAITDAALAGFGVAHVPHWLVASRVRAGALVLLLEGAQTRSLEVHAVWPKNKYLPSKTRAAIDALAAEVPARLR